MIADALNAEDPFDVGCLSLPKGGVTMLSADEMLPSFRGAREFCTLREPLVVAPIALLSSA
jgi:hypothetical protein